MLRTGLPRLCRRFLPLLLAACSADADNTYSSLPARLVVQTVAACPALYMAVGNPGQWCTVQGGANNTYVVTGAKETSQMNLTQMTGYQGFYLGLAGLIIGMPNIPEVGADMPRVTCYDLACPNCWREIVVGRALTIDHVSGYAVCGRCSRRYNLNNQGIAVSEEGGHPLERYRIQYNGTSLTVSN